MVGRGNVIQMIGEWVGGWTVRTYDGYYINCNILFWKGTHTQQRIDEMDL